MEVNDMTLIQRYNIFKKDFFIVAIDYDNTITIDPDGTCDENAPLRVQLIEILKWFRGSDSRVRYILWTCRENQSLEDAVNRCNEVGLYFDAVNDNIPEAIELFNGGSRKITFDLCIDDKNLMIDQILFNGADLLYSKLKEHLNTCNK